jgi:hypothetical protein
MSLQYRVWPYHPRDTFASSQLIPIYVKFALIKVYLIEERSRFLAELHKRIDLDDSFDEILCLFLEMRNTFVHNLDEIPGWSLDHGEGLAVARKFLAEFIRMTDIVQSVFTGLVRSWQDKLALKLASMTIVSSFRVP